jgi:hypothetical protein
MPACLSAHPPFRMSACRPVSSCCDYLCLPACTLVHAAMQLAGRVAFSYQGSDFVTPISEAA